MIGSIERVTLRQVWRHGAHDFTVWLEANLGVLSDAVGLNLTSIEREHSAGNFSVDLLAEDDSGESGVIENQLERSDHDHLGKLLTYLATVGATKAIWIVAEPRPEHVSAVSWLNESSTASVYLFKIEAIRIADSPPAPLLTLIVGPSDEIKQAAQSKQEKAGRHAARRRFWTGLLTVAKERTLLHSSISPSDHGWIGTGAGKQGITFNYHVRQHDASIGLYIDRGKDGDEENLRIFGALYQMKTEVENAFGEVLEWNPLDTRRACWIGWQTLIGGYRDEEKSEEVQLVLVDAMIRFEAALRPHLNRLNI